MTDGERNLLATGALLLAQGERLDRLSRPLTVGALLAVLATPLFLPGPPAAAVAVPALIALAGLAETWFAMRVGFDAALLRALAEGRPPGDLEGLDAALLGAGLLPQEKAGRPAEARLAGAMRLLRQQGMLLGVQVAAVAAGGALAIIG